MSFLLTAALIAAAAKPHTAKPNDMRVSCTGDAKIEAKDKAGKGAASHLLRFDQKGQRIVTLPSGHVLIAKADNDGQDELLLQESGRYRRLMKGTANIRYLSESPDEKWVAVVLVQGEAGFYALPQGALYMLDTAKWEGHEVAKNFGFSAIAWSPDSSRLAYGDFSKLRIIDPVKGTPLESCVFDSQTTSDFDERLLSLGFLDAKTIRVTYENLSRSSDYVVKLP